MKGLEKEMATFKRELPRLLAASEGKFVLIQGDTVLGTFSSYEDALQIGYERVGLEPFLVKQVTTVPAVAQYSRAFRLCPA